MVDFDFDDVITDIQEYVSKYEIIEYTFDISKSIAIKHCLILGFDLKTAEKYLKSLGYSLSKSIRFDLIIRYCLEKRLTNLNAVNEILFCIEKIKI